MEQDTENTEKKVDGNSLCDQDFITLKTGYDFGIKACETRAVNFQYILKTGEVDALEAFGPSVLLMFFTGGDPDPYVDLKSDDAYTRALDTIKTETLRRIAESQELQDLKAKDPWTYEDRVAWEKSVSKIVSEEMDKISGLDEYRVKSDGGAKRIPERINDVSEDMKNGTTNVQFACREMSITEGIILQQVDNALLPEQAQEGDYKVRSNYFYVGGKHANSVFSDEAAGHAFIISSLTGNIIDATHDPSEGNPGPYIESRREGYGYKYTFEDFTNGVPFVEKEDCDIYMKDGTNLGEREGAVGRELTLARSYDMQDYVLSKYKGFPEEITFKGETMPFKEALLDPEAFDQIRAQYEAKGETDAVEALDEFEYYQRQIQKVLSEYDNAGVPKMDEIKPGIPQFESVETQSVSVPAV